MDYLKIIEENLKFYDSIKPKNPDNSYTVLATLNELNSGQLLALATGTQANLRVYPDDIEDCHAESLIKRAFKRYILDKLLYAINHKQSSDSIEQTIELINQYQLILFVTQFPCGLLKRYQGFDEVLLDKETGLSIERKPGRGQVIDGKVVYVQRSSCLTKLKRWIKSTSFQGKLLGQTLGLTNCKISHILIGNCEQLDLHETQTHEHMENLRHQLEAERNNIICTNIPVRRNDFICEPSLETKQPQPVAMVWWQKEGHSSSSTINCCAAGGECEFLVDGRKMGLTKKQCQSGHIGNRFKLKIGDHLLKEDLAKVIQSLK